MYYAYQMKVTQKSFTPIVMLTIYYYNKTVKVILGPLDEQNGIVLVYKS